MAQDYRSDWLKFKTSNGSSLIQRMVQVSHSEWLKFITAQTW